MCGTRINERCSVWLCRSLEAGESPVGFVPAPRDLLQKPPFCAGPAPQSRNSRVSFLGSPGKLMAKHPNISPKRQRLLSLALWTPHLQIELVSLCLPLHHESPAGALIHLPIMSRPWAGPTRHNPVFCLRRSPLISVIALIFLCSQPYPHLLKWQTVQGGNEHFKTLGHYCNSGKYCY